MIAGKTLAKGFLIALGEAWIAAVLAVDLIGAAWQAGHAAL